MYICCLSLIERTTKHEDMHEFISHSSIYTTHKNKEAVINYKNCVHTTIISFSYCENISAELQNINGHKTSHSLRNCAL